MSFSGFKCLWVEFTNEYYWRSLQVYVVAHKPFSLFPLSCVFQACIWLISQILKKLNIDLTIQPSSSLPRYILERIETCVHKNVDMNITRNSQKVETDQTSVNWWCIQKRWCICTMGYYAAIERNEMLLYAATWKSLGNIMRSWRSWAQKTTY